MIDSEAEIRVKNSLMDKIIQNGVTRIQRGRDGRVWYCALMINHGDMTSWSTRSVLSSQKICGVHGDRRGRSGIDTFGVTMLRKINISVETLHSRPFSNKKKLGSN